MNRQVTEAMSKSWSTIYINILHSHIPATIPIHTSCFFMLLLIVAFYSYEHIHFSHCFEHSLGLCSPFSTFFAICYATSMVFLFIFVYFPIHGLDNFLSVTGLPKHFLFV